MDAPLIVSNGSLPPLGRHDALLVVDVQNDFLPGGALPVPGADEVIPILNAWLDHFAHARLPVYATRDWHPLEHVSFRALGGPWPPHAVAGSRGAALAERLALPADAVIVSKGTVPSQQGYSAFEGTDLARDLRRQSVRRLFVGGLATEYCVLHTVCEALEYGFDVVLLVDAMRAVDFHGGEGAAALDLMRRLGATVLAGTPQLVPA